MKLPITPPGHQAQFTRLLTTPGGSQRLQELTALQLGPAPGGKYRHWDTFRHTPPRSDFPADEQWFAVKLARSALYQVLPLTDAAGVHFRYALPNVALQMLHEVDRFASGNIQGPDQVTDLATRDTYLFRSIVEEAITSSQLEGASTTRKVAKAMIQEGRPPKTRSERMILNNYQGMRRVLELVGEPLTPELVIELQRILTEGALEDPDGAGRFRRADEEIAIEDDETGVRLHTPPPADQLERRMHAMCEFANGSDDGEFMPPAVRAILLHLWLACDHPFVDGNGRTARALFYWSMARQGYWLCEYVSISRILRKARGAYARAYLYTETDEYDATYFILYQLRVLLRAIHELHHYLARKSAELHQAEELIRRASAEYAVLNQRQLTLINHALRTPHARYTIASHRRSHGVTYETARTDLMKLADEGLLDRRKSGREFVYVPHDLLRERLCAPRRGR